MGAAGRQADEQGRIATPGWPLERLLESVLDEIGIGLIVCEPSGAVRLVNRCAEQELADGSLLRRVGPTLRCAGTSNPALEAAMGLAARRHCRQLVALGDGTHRLMVSVVPLPSDEPHDTLVMLMLGSRDLCSAQGLELLAAVHGLTSAERRVLADLLHERTPREIAAAHGVSLTTVRTQIVSIRAKFGVHSIEALLRRVAALPPDPGAVRRGADAPAGVRLH
jgi:DNA-binding CsgD family transcriptional regulator